MGVEQHRRRALGAGLVRDHRRRAAVGADDVDPRRTPRRGTARRPPPRPPHLARARRVGAHRLDPDQVLEVLRGSRAAGLDRRADVVAHAPTLGPARRPGIEPDGSRPIPTAGRARGRLVRRWRGPGRRLGVGPGELAGGEGDPGLGVGLDDGRRRAAGVPDARDRPAPRRTAAPAPRPSGRARAPRARRGSAWSAAGGRRRPAIAADPRQGAATSAVGRAQPGRHQSPPGGFGYGRKAA